MSAQNWDLDQIPSQEGRVVIVTGASSGLGLLTAQELSRKGAEVIMAVRNEQRGQAAMEKIKAEVPNAKLVYMHLDVADLSSVQAFAEQFKSQYNKLDLLINNAGIMMCPHSLTKDGFEIQMGTNHLGHFALTGQLLSLIQSTEGSRIINLSSRASDQGNIKMDDWFWEQRKYNPMNAYGDSKLANLYFTFELARKLKAVNSSVKVVAAHPGWAATELQRHSGLFSFLNNFFAAPTIMGTLPTLRAAVDPGVESGTFYGPSKLGGWRGYPGLNKAVKRAHDESLAAQLWKKSEQATGVTFEI